MNNLEELKKYLNEDYGKLDFFVKSNWINILSPIKLFFLCPNNFPWPYAFPEKNIDPYGEPRPNFI